MWCEKMAVERGLVDFPGAELIQLQDALWRAHRIVIDCGLQEGTLTHAQAASMLQRLADGFSVEDAARVKAIERTTNHDVKAVEYFLKEKLSESDELKAALEFVNFACTSEHINNLSYALMLKQARDEVLLPPLSFVATANAVAHLGAVPHFVAVEPTGLGRCPAALAARLEAVA
jgi:adenylosuccinate lyase